MNADNPALLAIVRAVADGTSVDWDSAREGASDSFKSALAELRVIAAVANLNRSLSGEIEPEPIAPTVDRPPSGRPLAHWGHLHLFEHVASGAFGDVYRAWDPAIDREVALKLLKPRAHAHDGENETIEEGRLLARVRHPNVVTVYGAARVDGRVGIWMEFVEGRTLAAAIQQDGPMTASEILILGATLCDAVAAVHDAGLLHRDIKAQNVMLAKDRRVVLMDFGAGRPMDEGIADVAGTPLYLAPEVAAGQEATPRSDVYSLGVLLHFLATGAFPRSAVVPRDGGQPHRLAAAHASGAIVTSPNLERIIARAIAWEPDRRFTSARDLGAALRQVSEPILPTRRYTAFLLAAAGVAVAAAVVIPLSRARFANAPPSATATPLRAVSSEEALRRLPWRVMPTGPPSQDGRFMGAVDWNTGTGAGVPVLIDLGTDQIRKLMDPAADEANTGAYTDSSSVAPDATRIAFAWSLPAPTQASELRVCGVDGSALRTVLRDTKSALRVVGWSATGEEVLVLRIVGSGAELIWVGVRDGHTRLVLRVPSVPFVSLHQNGRDLLLDLPQRDGPYKRDLMIADMLTGDVRPLLVAPANDAMPVWLPDGHHVLFASDRGGTVGAWLTDAEGTEPQQVRGSMGNWQPLGFGAHGELYYLAQTGTVDVYTARVDLATRTVGPRQAIATSFQGRSLFSDWAPDNRHVAFISRRGLLGFPISDVSVVTRDIQSNDERVFPIPTDIGPPRWAPDGRRLAVLLGDPHPGVLLIDARSGRTELSCTQPGPVRNIEWASNDAVWLIVSERSGNSLRAVTFPSCTTTELARDVPAFSISRARDQLAIMSQTRDAITVAVAPLNAIAERHEILRSPGSGQLHLAGWTPDDEFIVAIGSVSIAGQQRPRLWEMVAIPSHGGTPFRLSLAPVGEAPRSARLSPDGSMLSFEAGAPLITNWVLEHPLFRH